VLFERDESGDRTASRGAGGLVTALTGLVLGLPDAVWVCAASSEEDAVVAAEREGRRSRSPSSPKPGWSVLTVAVHHHLMGHDGPRVDLMTPAAHPITPTPAALGWWVGR
jgi:hypothetical protein